MRRRCGNRTQSAQISAEAIDVYWRKGHGATFLPMKQPELFGESCSAPEGSESNFMSELLDDDMTGLHFMTSVIGWLDLRCFRLGWNLLSPLVFRHQTNVGFSSLTVLLISSHFVKKVDIVELTIDDETQMGMIGIRTQDLGLQRYIWVGGARSPLGHRTLCAE